ncbi:hypothetical protein C4D60_Mb04t07830 [Musa balbisiana]|uniref:GPI inositol-deacylase n=1 Tax=Musa balbisiana TaxID=52838 RepID=A0A4S8KAF0_MUSBA|nr:hypothetical protein C4D60_Mb04t07830 [Musa balbisiana]
MISSPLVEACGVTPHEIANSPKVGIAMDDYFVRILELASYLSHRLIQFIEDILFSDIERFSQDSEASVSGCHERCLNNSNWSSQGDLSVSYKPSANIYHLESARRLINHQRNYGIIGSRQNSYFIHQVILFSLCGLRVGGRVMSTCSRCFYMYLKQICIEAQGFISRVKRTLQGSSDDIGWLQRSEQFPPMEDGTTHFMELLHDKWHSSSSQHSGLFSNHGPLYFVNTKQCFSKMGLTCHIAKIHSEASVERNSWELKQYIEELYWGSGKCVMLLGHSKGGVDAAAALSMYWSDLKDKVAGLALVQSPYGGSPIASDILREGQVAYKEARRIMEFIICKIIKGDMRSLEDLTYEKRREFISNHRLPVEQVPLVSFHTEARVAPGVIATMSHIAHAELPWLPLPRFLYVGDEFASGISGRKVPVVIPVAAAMAICALHLKLRYGEASDGLVTRRDAEVPGSVVVRLERKLDHAWMVYSSQKKDQLEADASDMCEALLTMLVEIGRKKQGEDPVANCI